MIAVPIRREPVSWSATRKCLSVSRVASLLLVSFCALNTMRAVDHQEEMKITLLGTGTPYLESNRFGSAVLVEAGGEKFLFDCGRGTTIRLSEANVKPGEVTRLFLTHLHSDHVVGIPDLWLTGWLLGRNTPLRVWGPQGTSNLVQHLANAFSFDVGIRASTAGLPLNGAGIEAAEIQEGTVYDDRKVRVTAFNVDHGAVTPALGYRVDYSGYSVVISGDTRFSENLIKFARGTDCLIHAAWSANSKNPTPPSQRSLASAEDAGMVFSQVRPRLAVVYHYHALAGLKDAVRSHYKGSFEIAGDLMSIVIGQNITWSNPGASKVSRD